MRKVLVFVILALLVTIFGCAKKATTTTAGTTNSPQSQISVENASDSVPDLELQKNRLDAALTGHVGYACGMWSNTFNPANLDPTLRHKIEKVICEHAPTIGLDVSPEMSTAKDFRQANAIIKSYKEQMAPAGTSSLKGKCFVCGIVAGSASSCAVAKDRLPSARFSTDEEKVYELSFEVLVAASKSIGLSPELDNEIRGLHARVKETKTYEDMTGPMSDVRPWFEKAMDEVAGR